MWRNGEIQYTENDEDWHTVPRGTTVSMNFWGFTPSMMREMEERFPAFLDKALIDNPLKGEFFLPLAVDQLLKENKARIKILPSHDRWFGVTYKEDREAVVNALQSLKDKVYIRRSFGIKIDAPERLMRPNYIRQICDACARRQDMKFKNAVILGMILHSAQAVFPLMGKCSKPWRRMKTGLIFQVIM
jgi:hypothetical protein